MSVWRAWHTNSNECALTWKDSLSFLQVPFKPSTWDPSSAGGLDHIALLFNSITHRHIFFFSPLFLYYLLFPNNSSCEMTIIPLYPSLKVFASKQSVRFNPTKTKSKQQFFLFFPLFLYYLLFPNNSSCEMTIVPLYPSLKVSASKQSVRFSPTKTKSKQDLVILFSFLFPLFWDGRREGHGQCPYLLNAGWPHADECIFLHVLFKSEPIFTFMFQYVFYVCIPTFPSNQPHNDLQNSLSWGGGGEGKRKRFPNFLIKGMKMRWGFQET